MSTQPASHIVIRAATEGDLRSLQDRQDRLVDAFMLWNFPRTANNGHGTDLCLIADIDGLPVGHLLAGPLDHDEKMSKEISESREATAIAAAWWKLRAIAVEPEHHRGGVGSALLGGLLDQLPAGIVGLYGNVERDRAAAIRWYRRRGLFLYGCTTLGDTMPRYRRGEKGVMLLSGDRTLYFRGWTRTLRKHRTAAMSPEQENQLALIESDRYQALRQLAGPHSRDVGFRAFATAFAARNGPVCPHVDEYGPRPLTGVGWDPAAHSACEECELHIAKSVEYLDSIHRCDGCYQSFTPPPLMSWARVRDHLFVSAGLCQGCRRRNRF